MGGAGAVIREDDCLPLGARHSFITFVLSILKTVNAPFKTLDIRLI